MLQQTVLSWVIHACLFSLGHDLDTLLFAFLDELLYNFCAEDNIVCNKVCVCVCVCLFEWLYALF